LALLYFAMHTLPRAWKTLNTDFPNYYMSASLVHDGYTPARMYEWAWIEREKDHRGVDLRVIGLLPITPFSTLAMVPLARFTPLLAKHIWILLSLGALAPIIWMLRSMTGLSYQRLVLVFALCFPLHRNLEFGQYYLILLLLIVAACWSYLRGLHATAGVLVAVAAACKIFPILFLIFFLRRRAWRTLSAAVAAGVVILVISVAVFGWSVHLTYLREILPWTLHGEAMPPYVPSASISGILHRLFLSEPQWNPHPWHDSSLCFALLMPTLQTLLLAPAILLLRKEDQSRNRILLEWSALLTASLTISTVPALYNFVLLAFPVSVLMALLLRARRSGWVLALLALYLAIGMPLPSPEKLIGSLALLQFARLPLLLVLLTGTYRLLWRSPFERTKSATTYVWATLMVAATVSSVVTTFHREHSMREEYRYRLPLQEQGFLNANPHPIASGVRYIAFTYSGYHVVTETQNRNEAFASAKTPDELSFADEREADPQGKILIERALSPHSQIVYQHHGMQVIDDDARDPMLSADGKDLALIRDDHGRGRLALRASFAEPDMWESSLTPPSLNVYEASFLSEREYAFSALGSGPTPQIYLTDAHHNNSPLDLGEARYPAISDDHRWMAFSRFGDGRWNLWLRDQGTSHQVSDVPCNQIQPTWEKDSKTILYSTDCGRSLWFTAIARRQIVP